MIKILHCADLHLDSPFSGLDPIQSEARREEQRELLRNLICYIRNQHIDLVLIAGDLFDNGYTNSKTVKYAADLFATVGCPVVISPGNHDPYTPNGIYSNGFPENVYIFDKKELSSFDFDSLGITVWGYAGMFPMRITDNHGKAIYPLVHLPEVIPVEVLPKILVIIGCVFKVAVEPV